MIPLLFLLVQFFVYLGLVNYFLKPEENEPRLSAWPKNIIRVILKAVLIICIIASCVLLALPALFLWLLNRTLVEEVRQFFNLMREIPEEERPLLMHGLVDVLPFVEQTTHDPNAVSSVNLSVDKLIEKYREDLNKEEFYIQLNRGNTTDIEEYIRQSNEFKADEKSQALECLKFINRTGNSFKDNYSQLTLKQAAILCWKACSDKNTGMEDQTVPLSDGNMKNRKDMFVRGLIDAATTYGNKGQSCAGGTYNKLFESLSGLHPLVVITLDEKETSKMVEEAITQGLPAIARKVLSKFSEGEQETIRKSFAGPSELSTETVMFITAVRAALEEKCQKFSSKLDSDKQKEILKTCMSNLSYVELGNPNQMAR
jgi:DNA-binding MarR family transcriptional regulator